MESINETLINEINIGAFTKSIFTGIKNFFKGTSDQVAKFASAEISKVTQRLAKSGTKNISITAIRSSTEYKRSLAALGEDYATRTYKKSYKLLTDAEKKKVITDVTKNLDDVIAKELKMTAGKIGGDIADDVLKGVKLVRSGQKTAQITKTINTLNKTTKAQAQRLIASNVRLIGDGTKGANIVSKIKSGQITIIKNGQVYTTQTKNLVNQPVKVYQISRKTLIALGVMGVSGLAAYFLYADMKKDETVILVDENGNTLTDEQINEWADCIQKLLKNKEGVLGYTPTGIVRVIVKNSEYPNGIAFFTNGRVANLETKERGSWKCKSGQAVIAESKKISFKSLLNEETNLSDIMTIAWDGKKTDDDKPTPPKPKYYDCSQKPLPHEFGCRSEQIKEIQKCLGLEERYQTGNFGPVTMRALGGNSLTKEVYEKIKSECGSQSNTSSSTTDYGLKGLGKFDKKFNFGSSKYGTTGGSTDTNINTPSSYGDTGAPVEDETPNQLYNRLKNEGLIIGDESITYYTDENGDQRSYGPSRRIVYKGPELDEKQYNDLNSVMTKLGYTDRLSQVANKKYGIKYVWVKKK
jgi:hypothetical protein